MSYIFDVERSINLTIDSILGHGRKKKRLNDISLKRPEGIHRELCALLYSYSDCDPSMLITEENNGYKQDEAVLGLKRIYPWKWSSFPDSEMKDGAEVYHWRPVEQDTEEYFFPNVHMDGVEVYHWRPVEQETEEYPPFVDVNMDGAEFPHLRQVEQETEEYPPYANVNEDAAAFHHWRGVKEETDEDRFAKFNNVFPLASITDDEYLQHLQCEGWTCQETYHLFELCELFDLCFFVIQSRWDTTRFASRSIEDLKERYYNVSNILSKAHAVGNVEPKRIAYRKKKTQDLQKLIIAADSSQGKNKHLKKKGLKRKVVQKKNIKVKVGSAGIKFDDFKRSGVTLRSQKMKLPASLGQK